VIDASLANALDRIAQRAADVQAAFTPGAEPRFSDVAKETPQARNYFIVRDDSGRMMYTRDADFAVRDGVLTDTSGRPVLGYVAPGANAAPLTIDPLDAQLRRAIAPHVEADGTFTYEREAIDPRTGARERERVVVGRVALARFPAASAPVAVDANHAIASPGVVPHVGMPGDGNFAPLSPMQSASRIDFDRSLDRLEQAYVAFDALQAAHKARGGIGKAVMDLLK
jgi:hypothetical protein